MQSISRMLIIISLQSCPEKHTGMYGERWGWGAVLPVELFGGDENDAGCGLSNFVLFFLSKHLQKQMNQGRNNNV